MALPRGNNKAAFWSGSEGADQSQGMQLIADADPV